MFTIDNSGGTAPVGGLAFTDNLPAGTTLAEPGFASNSCGGTVTAPDNGSTITLIDGGIGAGVTCEISVNVTSGTTGVYSNTSDVLTSDAGNSGAASADLTVDANLPGFTKSFAPSIVEFGGRSTLTFTIDNTSNGSLAQGLNFVDTLPDGMVLADPANSTNGCNGTLTADPGADELSLVGGFVPASETCTITVDVIGGAVGELENVSDDLSFFSFPATIPAGKATAVLEVTGFEDLLSLEKEFVDDPAAPGGTATLEFTVTNRSRRDPATGIAFTDDLDAALSGLVAVPPLPTEPCGPGSTVTGTSVLTLTGGNLPAEGSCTFSVVVQAPEDAPPGTFPNTTSDVTGTVGGSPETGDAASDALFIVPFPVLTKTFADNPVAAGGTATLEFTITNPSSTDAMENIGFQDVFDTILPDASGIPAPGFCGPPSTADFTPLSNPPGSSVFPPTLVVSNASLAPGGSCTFQIFLDVAVGASAGTYPNTTTQPTATVGGAAVTGRTASDDLDVVGAPRLSKRFTDDLAAPGATVGLEFSLSHDEFAPGDATGITFTDDLSAVLSGLTANLPVSPDPPCGPGSSLTGSSGDTFLTLSGGSLAPGEDCTFSVMLNVPADAVPGTKTNTTSEVNATVDGLAATGAVVQDDFLVSGFRILKEFNAGPVIAGDTATLTFTLDNTSGAVEAESIAFQDDLDDAISGMTVSSSPANPCNGSLSSVSTNSVLQFFGGSVAGGGNCSFDVTVQVPAGTPDDVYVNTTTGQSASLDGSPVALDAATDSLEVSSTLIGLAKSFTNDPVAPGDTVTLEFEITNLSTTSVADIELTDDLNAAVAGLTFNSILANECSGSTVSGASTGMVTVESVGLTAEESCTIRIAVEVPESATGDSFTNTTSAASGTVAPGLTVTGDPASDTLQLESMLFTKDFTDDPSVAGGTATLSFTITNTGSDSASGLSFTDDLDAVLPGMEAVPPLPDNPCGAGSTLSGTSFLILSGGSLAAAGNPGDSCTFMVTVNVPEGAADGTFVNTTSELFAQGLAVTDPATALLEIEPPPGFSKQFAPDLIAIGGISTLTFTIDNTGSALAATGLDFTDNLPAGVTVADPADASTTCTGGTLTAVSGSGVISYTGGTATAGASCAISVEVTASTTGAFVNTSGDLTSSSGVSGTASDTLSAETDSDGDGIVDSADPDDDNDGLEDGSDPDPLDPDFDGDQIIDGLDPEPEMFDNTCVGFGMPEDVTVETLQVPAGQTITCGVPGSITVESTVDFEPTGRLVLIAPRVTFSNGFSLPSGALLNVISKDPTALISPDP